MELPKPRKWYQKKRFLFPLGAVILVSALSGNGNKTTPIPAVNTFTPVQEQRVSEINTVSLPQEQNTTSTNVKTTTATTNLSNDNYYTNVDGNRVHSPAYSDTIPAGASARCGDGTYSFSQNSRGTCSRHGGVSEWLR